MITKTLHKFYLVLFIFMLSISVHASDVALPDDAKAMCEKAATFIKENGIEAAKTAFQTPGAPWHDRDLYVFIFDKTGVMIAHGAKEDYAT
jgi:cytochrome c